MRPWTRRECARLLSEAEELARPTRTTRIARRRVSSPNWSANFARKLERADEDDGGAFRVESVVFAHRYISGTPLRDGYHFAQTQINDFGRPYGEGWNNVNGFSTYAT